MTSEAILDIASGFGEWQLNCKLHRANCNEIENSFHYEKRLRPPATTDLCCEGREMAILNTPRLAINVGITLPDNRRGNSNKQDMQKGYTESVITTGFRAHARGDMLEGRRTDLFMNRVSEFYDAQPEAARNSRISRLRQLERRGIIFEAITDLIPSLFTSIWRILPGRKAS